MRCPTPALTTFLLPLGLVLALTLSLSLGACSKGPDADEASAKSSEGEADSTAVEEAIPVEIALLKSGPMEAVLRASANLEAEEAVTVFAEAARRVRTLLVEEGDVVKKGQLLARLQNAEQRSNLAKAEARFDQLKREYERQQKLLGEGLTTEKAFNDALSDHDQQRLALDDARRELGYTEVRATIAGTVTGRSVSVGDQVNLGTALFELVDFNSLVARVYIPEKNLAVLKPGLDVRLRAKAVAEEPYFGQVRRVSPVVDPATGTVKVTVGVGGQPGLRPGLFVDVELVTAVNEDALRLPKRALVYEGEQAWAWAVVEGKATRRSVAPLLADASWVEPAGGFSAGDTIVVAGQAALEDGREVEIYDRDAEVAAGAQ